MTVIAGKPAPLLFRLASGAVCVACWVLASPAAAVDQAVDLGVPTVLSQQGQRLKVMVPVRSAPHDRATAASFLVRETEVPRGYDALPAQDFTVMRPALTDYVLLQSGDIVHSPEVSLVVSVAGDPRSPYRMDLQVPPASASFERAESVPFASNARASRRLITRKLSGPTGELDLPPK
ncbi:MAG TPA: hypothetical protein VEY69_01085 [Lautropia sp.]|jgi:hypothetical protein|nr:hypothetical protein [Lautropia sp.]